MKKNVKLRKKDIFPKGRSFHFAKTTFKFEEKHKLHTHDFYEFMLVEEGKMTHNLNSTVEEVDRCTLFFIKPNDIHAISNFSKSKELKICNLAVSRRNIRRVIKYFGLKSQKEIIPKVKISLDEWSCLQFKIMQFQKNYLSNNQKYINFFVDSLVINLVALLITKTDTDEKSIPVWLKKSYEEMFEPKNFTVGLARFIELSNRSQEHINRCMKKYYETTPTAFINLLRLRYATQLLTSTEKSIISVIYDSGFENVSHFSKLFKKQFGVTPRIFRQRNKMIYNLK